MKKEVMKMGIGLSVLALLVFACETEKKGTAVGELQGKSEKIDWNNDIIYHVVQRSFYDSNGDRHGDLNGFVQKLGYLKELGVTTILFTPLYESGFYHNYFPTDYMEIDHEYGSKEDYFNFVKAVHAHGMKFLMDMETQYAQSGNIWFDLSYRNPDSEHSDFIYYSDSLNQYPEQIFRPSKSELYDFNAWPGLKHNIVYLDLNHPKVKQWMIDFYVYWVDPNGDGRFDDGVDGFRIDHIMDDLDYKGMFTNMYGDFWKPIFDKCKALNPNIFVLGEQSNWNEYGEEMVKASGADAAFGFPLRFALAGEEGTHDMYKEPSKEGAKMDPKRFHNVIKESLKRFGGDTYVVNFLENHDTSRWASWVVSNPDQKRSAAALYLLAPGIPSVYYGQELGLPGEPREWGSDANHIPVREAFPWTWNPDEKGNALFYKDTGEWWEDSFWNGPSIKELALNTQRPDTLSLWNHYRKLINIRKNHAPFRLGNYEPLLTDNTEVIAFKRSYEGNTNFVIVNGSNTPVELDDFNDGMLGDILYLRDAKVSMSKVFLEPNGIVISKGS
ncbi:MAG: alpha-amylase family glycosyl hydrolase [Bacteroidota bacterium]